MISYHFGLQYGEALCEMVRQVNSDLHILTSPTRNPLLRAAQSHSLMLPFFDFLPYWAQKM